ncbi:MAG: hypothetical protein ACJ8DH_01345 [Microvirga sp.]
MLVLLRIILTVGVLFWYSPLRAPSPWEKPGEARPAASQEGPHGFGPSSFERVGRVIRAWEMLPDEDRDTVLRSVVRSLPPIAATRKPGD